MTSLVYLAKKLTRHVLFNYNEGGIRRVLFKVGQKIRRFVHYNDEWILLTLPLNGYAQVPNVDLSWTFLDIEGLHSINYAKLKHFPEAIRERLLSGARCVAFHQCDDFVNLHWFSLNSLPIIPGLTITEPGCCGDFDVFTVPQFQGRGINTAANVIVATLAKHAGAQYMLVVIRPNNIPSIKSYKNAGYTELARIRYETRFGLRFLVRVPLV